MKTLKFYVAEIHYRTSVGSPYVRSYSFRHKSSADSFVRNLVSHYSVYKDCESLLVDGFLCKVSYGVVDVSEISTFDSSLISELSAL